MMNLELLEIERKALSRLVAQAREEDLGPGDATACMFSPETKISGRFVSRQDIVFCGGPVLEHVAKAYDSSIEVTLLLKDGDAASTGDVLAEWTGPAGMIMAAERPALNFLQRLSGIATMTRRFVDLVSGTSAEIYDTRKTLPGWRDLEKYAVRAGGGRNHRRGLYDSAMIKDNHLVAALGDENTSTPELLAGYIDRIRAVIPPEGFIAIEVDTLQQLASALKLTVDIILLDNMNAEELARAVEIRKRAGKEGQVQLEASGGITLENVAQLAATGVDRIAIGAITHSAPAVDIGLDMG